MRIDKKSPVSRGPGWSCVYALTKPKRGRPQGEPCVTVLQRFRDHQSNGTAMDNEEAAIVIDVLTSCCIVAKPDPT